MTHAGMSEEARKTAGISNALLRISVGIEDSLISSTIYKMRLMQQRKGNHGS